MKNKKSISLDESFDIIEGIWEKKDGKGKCFICLKAFDIGDKIKGKTPPPLLGKKKTYYYHSTCISEEKKDENKKETKTAEQRETRKSRKSSRKDDRETRF